MAKKELHDSVPEKEKSGTFSVKVGPDVEMLWREVFGSRTTKGREPLPLKDAMESAMLLFLAYPEEARYWFAIRLPNAEFRKNLSEELRAGWQKLRESLPDEA